MATPSAHRPWSVSHSSSQIWPSQIQFANTSSTCTSTPISVVMQAVESPLMIAEAETGLPTLTVDTVRMKLALTSMLSTLSTTVTIVPSAAHPSPAVHDLPVQLSSQKAQVSTTSYLSPTPSRETQDLPFQKLDQPETLQLSQRSTSSRGSAPSMVDTTRLTLITTQSMSTSISRRATRSPSTSTSTRRSTSTTIAAKSEPTILAAARTSSLFVDIAVTDMATLPDTELTSGLKDVERTSTSPTPTESPANHGQHTHSPAHSRRVAIIVGSLVGSTIALVLVMILIWFRLGKRKWKEYKDGARQSADILTRHNSIARNVVSTCHSLNTPFRRCQDPPSKDGREPSKHLMRDGTGAAKDEASTQSASSIVASGRTAQPLFQQHIQQTAMYEKGVSSKIQPQTLRDVQPAHVPSWPRISTIYEYYASTRPENSHSDRQTMRSDPFDLEGIIASSRSRASDCSSYSSFSFSMSSLPDHEVASFGDTRTGAAVGREGDETAPRQSTCSGDSDVLGEYSLLKK